MAAVATVATPDDFSRGIKLSITEIVGFISELNGVAIIKPKGKHKKEPLCG
jgi:hypothetical protein